MKSSTTTPKPPPETPPNASKEKKAGKGSKKPPLAALPDPEPEEEAPPPPLQKVHIVDGKLVIARANRYFRGISPLATLPGIEIAPPTSPVLVGFQPSLVKMSYDQWKQICAFHRWSVATFHAETNLSHLLTRDGDIVTLPFHQKVTRNAMTIHVDYTTPENRAILERLQEEQGVNVGDFHGTTHNHVVMSAFASGTDKDDEEDKQGYHFTIGNCDKATLSIHGRVRMKFNPVFDADGNMLVRASSQLLEVTDWSQVIDIPHVDHGMPIDIRKGAAAYWLQNCPDEGFPEEWKAYIELRPPIVTGYTGGGRQGPPYYGGPGQQQYQGGVRYTTPPSGSTRSWPGEDDEWDSRKTPAGTNAGSPAGGREVARVAVTDARSKGHQLLAGAVDEDLIDDRVSGGASIPKHCVVKFARELAMLDVFATMQLTLVEARSLLTAIKSEEFLEMYGAQGACGRAMRTIIDGNSDGDMSAVCENLLSLFATKPGYVVSTSWTESPANRLSLSQTFMAAYLEDA